MSDADLQLLTEEERARFVLADHQSHVWLACHYRAALEEIVRLRRECKENEFIHTTAGETLARHRLEIDRLRAAIRKAMEDCSDCEYSKFRTGVSKCNRCRELASALEGK